MALAQEYKGNDKSMLQLELRVMAPEARVISGETLPVNVMVINPGPDAQPMVDPDDTPPYEYRLYRAEDETVRYLLSDDAIQKEIARGPMQKREPLPPYMLRGGRKTGRQQDLAELTAAPFAPGRYLVEVTWKSAAGRLVSNRAPLEVRAPDFQSFVSETGVGGSPLAVAAANRDEGKITVFQQEPMNRLPGLGPLFPRAKLEGGTAGVAAAVGVEPTAGGRWIAWLEGGMFHATFGHGQESSAVLSQAVELGGATLLPVGYQYRDRGARFYLYLPGEGGRLAQVTVSLKEGVQVSPAMKLAGMEGSAPRTSIHLRESLDLYWAGAANGRTRLVRQTVNLAAWAAGAAWTVADLPGELAAWDCANVDCAFAHVLLAPDELRQLRYYRLAVDKGNTEVEPAMVPAPSDPVRGWAVLANETAGLPILATSGEHVRWTMAGSGWGWMDLTGGDAAARWPKLFSFDDGNVWAQWIEPARGAVRVMLDSH
jgi:hypothetical protein